MNTEQEVVNALIDSIEGWRGEGMGKFTDDYRIRYVDTGKLEIVTPEGNVFAVEVSKARK